MYVSEYMLHVYFFFFFKQKTAYEMRISDWSSDVCSSDLEQQQVGFHGKGAGELDTLLQAVWQSADGRPADRLDLQEVDDLLDRLAMGDLLAPVGAPVDRLLEQVALHLQHAAGHDVVEIGRAHV